MSWQHLAWALAITALAPIGSLAATTTGSAHLVNISARAQTGGVAGTPVTGFVIKGTGAKRMLLRAVGPELSAFRVTGALTDPSFALYAADQVIGGNDDWNAPDSMIMTAAGAFALSPSSRDAALVTSLPAGLYTAPVSSDAGDSGVSLLEAYDASTTNSSYLVNASVRAYVGTGYNNLVPGFVIAGTGNLQVLIRAVGPSLAGFQVADPLANPTLTLTRLDGTVLATNDDWSQQEAASEVASTALVVGAFPLTAGSRDAALLATLPAGSYTATVSGVGDTTGTALVELYAVNAGPSAAFTMDQTISDGAQRTTLAFSALAMITGNLESQSFFPPGKVADYTGFQYLRDNDPDDMGHNTSFLTRIANNVIYLLNDAQFEKLKTLAVAQMSQIDLYGYKRFPFLKAFRRLLDGDLPSGTTGLNLNAMKKASRELYRLDGQISYDRAVLYSEILGGLDPAQIAYLESMRGKGWKSWPDITEAQISARMRTLPKGTAVAVMTYASDLFSWYAGSVEADVYFCPERHGTYFGSFYIKDAPAIGHEGYSISEQLTATAGAALCDAGKGYVTPAQATLMSSLVDTQRQNLYAGSTTNIIQLRTRIATLLRALRSPAADAAAIKSQVLTLSETYGELDGENNYNYATVFAQVGKSLSADQRTRLAALRKQIMSGTYSDGTPFDYSTCTTPFLYSGVITDLSLLAPYYAEAEALFREP